MRPLEWLLLLSFALIVLLPAIPRQWRRLYLLLAAPLPALVCVAHLLVEGWRAQMAPLYLLAALVLVSRLPALLGHTGPVSRRRDLLASIVSVVILVPGAVLAGWLLPVIALPAPSGPYAVGIVDRELVDAARGRRLMVSVWYPAATQGPPAPLTHHPDELMTALRNLTGLPALVFQHLRYITLAASENVPVLGDPSPFPALVFSHGLVGMRLQNSPTLQDLASWGYVVVAIDHTDAAAVTVFPDGEARYYDAARFGIPAGGEPSKEIIQDRMFPVWVADQRFVYDTLEAWQAHDPLLAGKLDLARIGSFGHSFGGATALEVCLVDQRCRAAVDLDGGLYGQSETRPAVRPVLLMTSADSSRNAEAIAGWQDLLARATGAAYWLELPHSSHLSFTFSQLLSPLLAPPAFDPRAGLQTIDSYLRAFFDKELRGQETLPLGPGSTGENVRWHTP